MTSMGYAFLSTHKVEFLFIICFLKEIRNIFMPSLTLQFCFFSMAWSKFFILDLPNKIKNSPKNKFRKVTEALF
jgi:hypothetical protein